MADGWVSELVDYLAGGMDRQVAIEVVRGSVAARDAVQKDMEYEEAAAVANGVQDW